MISTVTHPMFRFRALALMCCLCWAVAGFTDAAVITFDSAVPSTRSEGDPVLGETFTIDGIHVSFDKAIFAQQGDPGYAFNNRNSDPGLDTGESGSFENNGNWFITDQSVDGDFGADPDTNILVSFIENAVTNLRFEIADLEKYPADKPRAVEVLKATAYDNVGGSVTKSLTGTSDGSVMTLDFGPTIVRSLEIDVNAHVWAGSQAGSVIEDNNRFAFGIDNLSASAVPAPHSLATWASLSLLGLVGLRLRRRRAES